MLQPSSASTHFPYTTLFRSLLRAPDRRRRQILVEPGLKLDVVPLQEFLSAPQIEVERAQRRAAIAGHETGRRSEEHTSELQSRENLVCRLLLEKKYTNILL